MAQKIVLMQRRAIIMGIVNCELTLIGRRVLIDMDGFLLFIYEPVCKAEKEKSSP
jgi:hypothetical protein